jgi:hypothetical protein
MHSARCARVYTRSRLTRGVADMPHMWLVVGWLKPSRAVKRNGRRLQIHRHGMHESVII